MDNEVLLEGAGWAERLVCALIQHAVLQRKMIS